MSTSFDQMVSTIPGFCGKPEDYEVGIDSQREFLASIPPLDKYAHLSLAVSKKYKNIKHQKLWALARYLKEMDVPTKHDNHLRQLAVKWCRNDGK